MVSERKETKLFSIASAGRDFGMIWSLSIMPVVAKNVGWKNIYVISIFLNLILIGVYAYWSSDSPKFTVLKDSSRKAHLPWLSFLKKKAVWAIIITHFCNNYTLWISWINLLWLYFRFARKIMNTAGYRSHYSSSSIFKRSCDFTLYYIIC
jgi:membrane protease YdiL (CAAX protease family)